MRVAVTVTGVGAVTTVVVIVNVAVVAPATTCTLAGVALAALSSDNVTVLWAAVPAAGAFKVTVPVVGAPAVTLTGFKVTDTRTTGLIDNPAVWSDPL